MDISLFKKCRPLVDKLDEAENFGAAILPFIKVFCTTWRIEFWRRWRYNIWRKSIVYKAGKYGIRQRKKWNAQQHLNYFRFNLAVVFTGSVLISFHMGFPSLWLYIPGRCLQIIVWFSLAWYYFWPSITNWFKFRINGKQKFNAFEEELNKFK